jgi:hypothetical protein
MTGLPFSWGNKYGNLAFQVKGSLKFETVKSGNEFCGTSTFE